MVASPGWLEVASRATTSGCSSRRSGGSWLLRAYGSPSTNAIIVSLRPTTFRWMQASRRNRTSVKGSPLMGSMPVAAKAATP